MRFRSKRYKACTGGANKEALPLEEAVARVKAWGTTTFNQSVECVINLGIDPRQADQAIRGSISLPHGIGKTLRVVVFCEGEDVSNKPHVLFFVNKLRVWCAVQFSHYILVYGVL